MGAHFTVSDKSLLDVAAWVHTLAAGTIVVEASTTPEKVGLLVVVADASDGNVWVPKLRFLKVQDEAIVSAWLEAEDVARVEFWQGGFYAMAPDTPDKAMAVRLRWA